MGRRYTVSEFRGLHARVKAAFPDSMFATDIIVGHPGEDEEAFEATVRLVEDLRFERVHLAQYSLRPHTRAAAMRQVSDSVKKERSRRLQAVVERVAGEIHASYLGRKLDALIVERGFRGGDSLVARLDNYFPVVVHGPSTLIGSRATVEVTDYTFFDLRGRILEARAALPRPRRSP